jgi:phosphatidylserine/phosphatidylglycerophosphate/cardiolipin synthase-like enzyme
MDVYFSPHGGRTEAVVRELDAAKESLLVQAHSFAAAPIAKALVDAHRRGVKVQVILDKSQRTERYSSATFLKNAGIPTYIDDKRRAAKCQVRQRFQRARHVQEHRVGVNVHGEAEGGRPRQDT